MFYLLNSTIIAWSVWNLTSNKCLGRPEPTVSWLVNGTIEPKYIGVKTDTHVVVNRLEIQKLQRDDLNTTFKCRATNTHLVPPQEKTVRLEMICK